MNRLRLLLFCLLAVAPVAAASAASHSTGAWRTLPKAPIVPDDGGLASVWTGKEMLVFGRHQVTALDSRGNPYVAKRLNVATSYDPAANRWRKLAPPGPTPSFMDNSAVWTGKEALVWGQGTRLAFNPRTNRWRRLPNSPLLSVHDGHGLVVWTGREMIGWGGGCCGDAFSDGVAYNPKTNRWRALAPSPLAGSQHPVGAWTGRELVIVVGDRNPDTGKPWPARLARAAAYDPATDTWRRIAPLPAQRLGATAVWDGHEVLLVGGARVGFAYDPAANRWRQLPRAGLRFGAATVWTGRQVLLWGGTTRLGSQVSPAHGLAYDPKVNRWSALPQAPLQGRYGPTAVWSGRSLIVWGGARGSKQLLDGAAFTPRAGS